MKKILYHISLLVLCCACVDPVEPPTHHVSITATQNQSSFLFAGLPVFFNIDTQESMTINKWSFGDGDTSSMLSPSHAFDFPGTYRASVLLNDGQVNIDSTITISPRLHLIGSKWTSENGKFLFENQGGGYAVIHTLNESSSSDNWMILSTSAKFDSLRSKKLPLNYYDEVYEAALNKNGNITALSDNRIMEITRSGVILKNVQVSNGWPLIRMTETQDGYIVAGRDFDGFLYVAHLNHDFDILSESTLDLRREGFGISEFYLEPAGTIRIHYYERTGIENPLRVFVKMDLDGTVLLEQNYSLNVATVRSFPLSSGYILYGGMSQNYGGTIQLLFTKIDESGNAEWTVTSPQEIMYPQYIHSGGITVIEDGSSVLIFFDNQKGIKINDAGEVVWSKRFGIYADTFDAAIRNSKGNIVLLGAHQFDYANFQFTNEYSIRDLVLLEIDTDGNIVP